jgi:hypothetical protein
MPLCDRIEDEAPPLMVQTAIEAICEIKFAPGANDQLWEEKRLSMTNQSSLLLHIERRFVPSIPKNKQAGGTPSLEPGEHVRRLQFTKRARQHFSTPRLMLWDGYSQPKPGSKNAKAMELFTHLQNGEIYLFPDGTVMASLEFRLGKLGPEGVLPVAEEALEPVAEEALEPAPPQSKRKGAAPPADKVSICDLEAALCRMRRAMAGEKIFAGPQTAQRAMDWGSPHVPGGTALETDSQATCSLLRKLHGRDKNANPVCHPFPLKELRDVLLAPLAARCLSKTKDGLAFRWPDPMMYSMIQVEDHPNESLARKMLFRLANGFDERYMIPETMDGLEVRSPVGNRWFGASRGGAVALFHDTKNRQTMERLRSDYFMAYCVALHQRHDLFFLNETAAQLLTRKELRKAKSSAGKEHQVSKLRRAMQEFLTHTRARQVSDHALYSEAYESYWLAMGLDALYASTRESITELDGYLERRAERARENFRRNLTTIGVPLTITAAIFGFNLTEAMQSFQILWNEPIHFAYMCGAAVAIFLVIQIWETLAAKRDDS